MQALKFRWLGKPSATETTAIHQKMGMIRFTIALAFLTVLRPATARVPETDTTVLYQNCSSNTYPEGSRAERGVEVLVKSLAKNAPPTGFNTSSYGHDGDEVYGLIQCRGDLLPSECGDCASVISSKILQSCRRSTSAVIQLPGCFLRYSAHNFFAEGGDGLKLLCKTGNRSHYPEGFTQSVRKLLYDVSIKAADNRGFWTQSARLSGPSSMEIYGLAQCWSDLSRTACGSCLTFAGSCVMNCQNAAPGAQYLVDNCFVRYDTSAFYRTEYPSAPPIQSRGRTRALLSIVMGAIIGTVLAILCRIVWKMARKRKIPESTKG